MAIILACKTKDCHPGRIEIAAEESLTTYTDAG